MNNRDPRFDLAPGVYRATVVADDDGAGRYLRYVLPGCGDWVYAIHADEVGGGDDDDNGNDNGRAWIRATADRGWFAFERHTPAQAGER